MRTFIILFFLFTLLEAKTTVIAMKITGLHQNDHQGMYDKVLKAAMGEKTSIKLRLYPPSRAFLAFKMCNHCCLSPANKSDIFYNFPKKYYQSKALNTAKVYIFTKSGSKALTSAEELKGRIVGLRRGSPYEKTFRKASYEKRFFNTLEQGIKSLELGRIDAFISFVPDIYKTFEQLGIPALTHKKASPLAVHEDALVCKGNASAFIKEFNEGLTRLKESKELEKILRR